MKTNQELKTSWAKMEPPYGAFDDYVVVESLIGHNRFYFRPEEFHFMMSMIHEAWKEGRIGYFQVLREWNELTGFNEAENSPSKIENLDDFMKSIELIRGVDKIEFAKITNEDIIRFSDFMHLFKEEGFVIMRE